MIIIDMRKEKTNMKKIIFGDEGEYITNNFYMVDSDKITLLSDDINDCFIINKKNIDNLIKALQLAKEWESTTPT